MNTGKFKQNWFQEWSGSSNTPRFDRCIRMYVEMGDLKTCGAPTQGRQHCASCRHDLATGDRQPRFGWGKGSTQSAA
jgi:hypothetical protein